MTNLESAIRHADELFEGSPWLRNSTNSDNTVPGCMNLSWGELGHLVDAAKTLQLRNRMDRHDPVPAMS